MEAVDIGRIETTSSAWGRLKSGARSRAGIGLRFRRRIENGDWDERILKLEGKIDLVCWGLLIAFVAFLIPIFLKVWL